MLSKGKKLDKVNSLLDSNSASSFKYLSYLWVNPHIDYIYDKEIMGPEEFHYLDKFNNEYFRNMREVRISSLYWVWDNLQSRKGTIKRSTIVELIPYKSLSQLLDELVDEERYEDCVVVRDIMELYTENERNGEYKQLF